MKRVIIIFSILVLYTFLSCTQSVYSEKKMLNVYNQAVSEFTDYILDKKDFDSIYILISEKKFDTVNNKFELEMFGSHCRRVFDLVVDTNMYYYLLENNIVIFDNQNINIRKFIDDLQPLTADIIVKFRNSLDSCVQTEDTYNIRYDGKLITGYNSSENAVFLHFPQ